MIETRRACLERVGGIRGVGLELGAFMRPTVSEASDPGVEMRYLDFFTTEQLREQAQKNGDDPDGVMPVDYVVAGEDYRSAIDRKFDFIIANHVFEHIVNPIPWLQMLCDLLEPEGHLLLTIPDRTPRCFDRFRDTTSFAHLMWDYLSDLTHEQKAWVHAVETNLYYDRAAANLTVTPQQLLNIDNIKKARHHPGVHCHVFLGATFLERIMKPMLYTRVVDFSLADYVPKSHWGEFYVVLRKGWTPFEFGLEEFYGQPLERPPRQA